MFCANCGKSYEQEVNYCCQCGAEMIPPARRRKKLMLSRRDRKIAGVCGGFAEYLDIDPTLVRVAWLVAALLGGWGFLCYLIAWIVIPEGAKAEARTSTSAPTESAAHA